MKTKTTTVKKASKHVIIFDHARVDPSHCLTDGLFRPLKRESYKGKSLDVRYKYKDYTFWWRNYSPLNITDQTVFFAVHRLASEKGRVKTVGPSDDSPTMQDARNALKLKYDASDLNVLVLETTVNEIAQIMGITDSGANFKQIKESLIRLSGVSFVIFKGDDVTTLFWQANLFSQMAGLDKRIAIAINPMLSRALVGGQSTFINMQEQRELKSEIAKRLHVWLSSWARDGVLAKIKRDSLMPHVWGDSDFVIDSVVLYRRRTVLRKAINELGKLHGWTCNEDKQSGMVTIKRPELGIKKINS